MTNPTHQAPTPSTATETIKQAEANLQAPVPGLALAQKEPEPAQAPPKETKPLTQAQATTDSVTAKAILPGTVFTTEHFMLDKPDSKTIIEKKVIASGNGKMTVSSINLNSKSKKPRIIGYTTEWNLLSSRNSDDSGWDYNPPIKYFDFPLYTGKKWNAKSIETNIRTGTTKEHIISATVGDWQTVTVPAGTFKGIKVMAVTQVTDLATGDKTSGTDTSWYVPDLGHSVKSITSSTNAEGKEQEQIIQLISYNESDRATAQDVKKDNVISESDGLSGEYISKGDDYNNELTIQELGNGKINFSITTKGSFKDSSGVRCVGELTNKIVSLNGNTAIFKDNECSLSIEFNGKNAVVHEGEMCGSHGMNCSFNSTYSKKTQNIKTKTRELLTDKFKITIEDNCGQEDVACNNVTYVGINRASGKSISLKGSTAHTTCADGVTPCKFLGWTFKSGKITYFVTEDGELTVRDNNKVILDEQGEWQK